MSQFHMPTVLLCGPSGIGKSSACIKALPAKHTYWICTERGALMPAVNPEVNPSGEIPDFDEILSFEHAYEDARICIDKALAGYRAGKYRACVIDTLSSLGDREYVRVRTIDRLPEAYGKANRELASRIQPLLWRLMDSGLLVVCIAHEKDPITIEGRTMPGGPKLPGDLGKSVPALFDLVLRCDLSVDGEGNPIRVFRHNALSIKTHQTKDRFGLVQDGDPMDLKDVLKRATALIRTVQG